ncbi:MAG: hypothetical protein QXQ50_02000 [Candidatus Bathyarchaeia archaeon]
MASKISINKIRIPMYKGEGFERRSSKHLEGLFQHFQVLGRRLSLRFGWMYPMHLWRFKQGFSRLEAFAQSSRISEEKMMDTPENLLMEMAVSASLIL